MKKRMSWPLSMDSKDRAFSPSDESVRMAYEYERMSERVMCEWESVGEQGSGDMDEDRFTYVAALLALTEGVGHGRTGKDETSGGATTHRIFFCASKVWAPFRCRFVGASVGVGVFSSISRKLPFPFCVFCSFIAGAHKCYFYSPR